MNALTHPTLLLNKETIVRFRRPRQHPERAFGKNGVAILACCQSGSINSSTQFTLGFR